MGRFGGGVLDGTYAPIQPSSPALYETGQGVGGRALSSRRVQRRVELLGRWRTNRHARPYACHAPVSARTLCRTWHPVLAKATGKSVVVTPRTAAARKGLVKPA